MTREEALITEPLDIGGSFRGEQYSKYCFEELINKIYDDFEEEQKRKNKIIQDLEEKILYMEKDIDDLTGGLI